MTIPNNFLCTLYDSFQRLGANAPREAIAAFLTEEGTSPPAQCTALLNGLLEKDCSFDRLQLTASSARRVELGHYHCIFELACAYQGVPVGLSATARRDRTAETAAASSLPQVSEMELASLRAQPDLLGSESPASLAHPVLCGDGRFYERSFAGGTELAKHGLVDCANHPDMTPAQWRRLAAAMPVFVQHVQPPVLAECCAAWLATSAPSESIPGREFFVFCRRIAGKGAGASSGASCVVQRAALNSLAQSPPDRWREFAALVCALSPALDRLGEQAERVVRRLALDPAMARAMRQGYPGACPRGPVPPAMVLGLARAMIDTDGCPPDACLLRARVLALACRQTNESPVEFLKPRDSDEENVLCLARILRGRSSDEVSFLADAILRMTGADCSHATATLHDRLVLAEILQQVPSAAHMPFCAALANLCAQDTESARVWPILTTLQLSAGELGMLSRLQAAVDYRRHYPVDLDAIHLFLQSVSAEPVAQHNTLTLLQSLILPAHHLNAASVVRVYVALAGLSREDQVILREERGQLLVDLAQGGGDRLARLASQEFLQGFCRDHRPLRNRRSARPGASLRADPTHRETAMDHGRMDAMKNDAQKVMDRIAVDSRLSHEVGLQQISDYLRSPAVDALTQQRRGHTRINERDNALRALRHLENVHGIDIKTVCVAVWQCIAAYQNLTHQAHTDQDQANMRYSLAKQLALRIEDDRHPVCVWGQGQRVLSALNGYGFDLQGEAQLARVLPAELLTALARQFSLQQDNPSHADVDLFCQRSLQQAERQLAPQEGGAFRQALMGYVRASEWRVPTCLSAPMRG